MVCPICNHETKTQEWTEETVTEIIVDAFESAGEIRPSQLIAKRHNAALETKVVKCENCERSFQLEPAHTESQQQISSRFEAKFIPEPNSGCWLWHGSSGYDGYGQFYLDGKLHKAHRASWILNVGAIPAEMCVLHRCDTPACVNPSHLFLGTLSDNNLDSVTKGRFNRPNGEKHCRSKLTCSKVRFIRLSKRTDCYLARKFGVRQQTISDIRRGRTWKHLL